MTESDVTRAGLRGTRPGRDATTGANAGRRWRGHRRGEQPVVPEAEFASYYGKPVLNPPVWEARDIAGYWFLGGLAGASSLLAAGSDLVGHRVAGRVAKAGAFGAGALSVVALISDLGRPARFLNMLRVFKVTSPMSVGSWLLAAYVPLTGVAALTALTGRRPRIGAAATAGSALLGPAVAAYTATLVSDTAVPAWHEGYPEMPFKFTGSAAMAAAGLGLLAAPPQETGPARNLAVLGTAMEVAAFERMRHRLGMVGEPYSKGRGGACMRAGKVLAALGVCGTLCGQRMGRGSRAATALSGAALVAASAATRFGVFHAGMASANDPRYTVVPQRQRLAERAAADGAATSGSVESAH